MPVDKLDLLCCSLGLLTNLRCVHYFLGNSCCQQKAGEVSVSFEDTGRSIDKFFFLYSKLGIHIMNTGMTNCIINPAV